MAKLIFPLRGVPEDEAEEVRMLFDDNAIDFYETSAGNWGISMPALWLQHNDDTEQAQMLLNEYQHNRAITQRALYQQLKAEGKAPSFFKRLIRQPLTLLIYLAGISLTLYVSVKFIVELGL